MAIRLGLELQLLKHRDSVVVKSYNEQRENHHHILSVIV